jgi:hypothetical protein
VTDHTLALLVAGENAFGPDREVPDAA